MSPMTVSESLTILQHQRNGIDLFPTTWMLDSDDPSRPASKHSSSKALTTFPTYHWCGLSASLFQR